jgi:polyhydroxyalkanoate synthesis regulator phasin
VDVEPDRGDGRARGPLEQTLLAALGWAAQTAEGADSLIDDLARRVGVDRQAMRSPVRDAITAWRREGERLGARSDDLVDGLVARVAVAHQTEVDDLALRVAQLEHRLKLLEGE